MNSTNWTSCEYRQSIITVTLLALPLQILLIAGCGSPAPNHQPVAVAKQDPVADFEWAIKRLDRALRVFKPTGSDGLNVTERKLDYELIPPTNENQAYSALVTITTEAAFLHAKRQPPADEKPTIQKNKEPEITDLLAPKEDVVEFVDIPGTGSQVPAVPAARIEPRVRETKTVFELNYIDGRWKLVNEPEKKYEQLWFEYAFE